jgi:hypothetical protein
VLFGPGNEAIAILASAMRSGQGDLLINTGSDNTYATDQPGIGMWLQGSYSPAKYGFTSYSVVAHVPQADRSCQRSDTRPWHQIGSSGSGSTKAGDDGCAANVLA